ncbi:MAG: flagellin [Myxococcota bacterium]|nr:flagellin [Myxococcota bacterium]
MAYSMLTNISSLGAQRNLSKTTAMLAKSIERLSSGMRINKSADDAAGLAISSKMSAHVRGLAQSQRNANDAVSLIQTAEGAMNEISGLLTRMRELSVQAATGGTLTTSDRSALDQEFQALESEIDRIVNVTKYNGSNLLNGAISSGVSFQVGILNSGNDRISVTISTALSSSLGTGTSSLVTATKAQLAITSVDSAIDKISSRRNSLGAAQNRLAVTISNLGSIHENLSAANSRIRDVDVASETATLARNQILMQAGVSVLAQANTMPGLALSLLA